MIITKEQQEAWISNYAKEATDAELFGFIDGIEKVMEVIGQAEPKQPSPIDWEQGRYEPVKSGWRRPTWQELAALQLIKEKYIETDAEFISQVRRMGLEISYNLSDIVYVREVTVNPEPIRTSLTKIDWEQRRYELVKSVAAEFLRVADDDKHFHVIANTTVTYADMIIEKLQAK